MRRLILILFIALPNLLFSQYNLKGKVSDSNTGEPLAFVNIIYNQKNQGTTSDLDGNFNIESKEPIKFLIFSYVGYQKDTISENEIKNKQYVNVKLKASTEVLSEVTVLPGENPAHRIIDLAIKNRITNNPEKSTNFSYTSYNKLYFTFDISALPIDTTTSHVDTLEIMQKNEDIIVDSVVSNIENAKNLVDSMYFFLMESVSERKFALPDKNSEMVIANRMSGLKNPMFFMLATQMQSFSFYTDMITVYDKKYLSPISKGSTNQYFFLLEDTLYNERLDTIFVISYQPRKGKNFSGLKGVLYINSNSYALQNVIAEPNEKSSMFSVSIQQKYELIDDKQWFPVQLNTNFNFPAFQFQVDGYPMTLLGVGKSYINNIELNPEFEKKSFNHISIETDKNANKRNEDFWNKHRNDTLSFKEKNTYNFIDSIGDEIKLDEKMALIELLATGKIPLYFLNIDLNEIMWYNAYEGYRLGLGLETNEKVLKWASVGGYGAYGFKDKAFKYGGHLEVYPHKKSELLLGLYYSKDIKIADYYTFLWSNRFIGTEAYGDLLVTELDPAESFSGSVELRLLRYLKTKFYIQHTEKNIINNERYFLDAPLSDFIRYTETGVSAKFAYKEKFMLTPRGNKLSLGTNYPILWLNFGMGVPVLDTDEEYLKVQARIYKSFTTKLLGSTSIILTGAWASENTPYSLLYKGHGSAGWLDVANSFNTMGINEFISNKFAHVFFRHDFGSLLFKSKYMKPEIALLTNIGWSDFSRKTNTNEGAKHGYNKVYYESGIQINHILRNMFIGYGFGVYYRYGSYQLPETKDNFAFKLTITYSLD
ncbi:MAG: carboxypeptidase-like regulatory domain-containing protein [Bacteroidales bacterium]|nr:carboxypeptidase-like regulatory domain-containing protein [Bacteroidales bacterium]